MKRFANVLMGVWALNVLLLLAYLTNRPLYQAFVDAGYEMYSCVDWDSSGHMIPGVCADAPPVFPVEQ